MAVTKRIVAYTSYQENGYEVRVHEDKSILVVCPPYKTEFDLKDLPSHREESAKHLLDFVEADLQHTFIPPKDEFED